MRLVLFVVLSVVLVSMSIAFNQVVVDHKGRSSEMKIDQTENSEQPASACYRLPGPWVLQTFLRIQANQRTTVSVEADSFDLSFVLFDNILDRNCTVMLTRQPEFWQLVPASDSCLPLPMPSLPSGLYKLTIKTANSVYTKRMVVMQ